MGTWADLTWSIKFKMASNVIDRARSISEVTKALVLGDLSELVNVDVHDLHGRAAKHPRERGHARDLEVGMEGIWGKHRFVPETLHGNKLID